MKANTKVTAHDVLSELGYEKPENYIGKMRVRIGGLPMQSPAHLVNIQSKTDKLEVIVGNEVHEIDVTETNEELETTAHAKQVLKRKGEVASEEVAKIQERKKAAKAQSDGTELKEKKEKES